MLDGGRRRRILDAAYVCFTRHGVRRTTMDDIARAAGMSRPAVYQYVRNKEDAFRRLAAELLDGTLAEARRAIDTPGDLRARLTGALEAKLGLALKLWRDSPAHAAELLGVDARLSGEEIAGYEASMCDLLAAAVAAARPAADSLEVAEILLAFTRGLEVDLSDPDRTVRHLRHGLALLVAGLEHGDVPTISKGTP